MKLLLRFLGFSAEIRVARGHSETSEVIDVVEAFGVDRDFTLQYRADYIEVFPFRRGPIASCARWLMRRLGMEPEPCA